MAELRQWVAAVDAEGGVDLVLPGGAALVMRDEPPGPISDGPSIVVEQRYMMMDGFPIGALGKPIEVGQMMASTLKRRAELLAAAKVATPPSMPLRLLLKKDESWSTVVLLAEGATLAGATKLAFVFEAKGKLTAPSAPLASEFYRGGQSRSSEELTELHRKLFGRCGAVTDSLAALSQSNAALEERPKETWKRIPDAIERCSCAVDLTEVKGLKWGTAGRYAGPPRREVAVTLTPCDKPDARVVEMPAAEKWETAHRALVDAARESKPLCLRSR